MKKAAYIFLFFFIFLLFKNDAQTQVVIEGTTVDTSTLVTGLNIPWEIQYGPDGWLWVTERHGRVSRIHPETGEQQIILDHTDVVHQEGESGMLGMALHPDFEQDSRVYLVYTYFSEGEIKERLVHFTYDGSGLTDEVILIDGIQGNMIHDGSRLVFTPDGKLLMTTGDAGNEATSQNIDHLSGKVLRINPDGSVPTDNPFGQDNYVFTFGHRNAQGLDYGAGDIIYSSEHGPDTDDEVNIIEAGRNYGWPEVLGFCDTPGEETFCQEHNVKEPMINWTPTIAPSDIVYYDSDAIPAWQGTILMTVLKDKRIVEMELSEDGLEISGEKHWFIDYWGRLRDICIGPDGEIYLATNGDSWSNNQPFTHSIVRLVPENTSTGQSDKKRDNEIRVQLDSAGIISIKTNDEGHNLKYFVLNSAGRIVETGILNRGLTSVNSGMWPDGFYLVSVQDQDQQLFTQKLIIR